MAYAAEETERSLKKHIAPEFLLIGLAREQTCFAARILRDAGVTLTQLRAIARNNIEHAAFGS